MEYARLGNVSMVDLFRASGYLRDGAEIMESMIERYLREKPALVEAWVSYSEDQRCRPAWYVVRPGDSLDGHPGWAAGYVPRTGNHLPEQAFADEYAACAWFVKRELESFLEYDESHSS